MAKASAADSPKEPVDEDTQEPSAKDTSAPKAPAKKGGNASSGDAAAAPPPAPAKKDNPVLAKRITLVLLLMCGVFFAWYIASDRLTPYTDQARIDGFIIPIAPQVSGNLTAVHVQRHTVVKPGDPLVDIDPAPYQLGVEAAEASLVQARQQVASQTASIKSSESRVDSAKAQLDIAQRDFDRMTQITELNPGALSQADRDRTTAALASATAQLASSEASLERAKESLGAEGDDNVTIKKADTGLKQAKLDLSHTSIVAPAAGLIENINLDVGYFASAGAPLMSIISMRDVWIEANFTENNLSNLKPGNRVEFVLDVAPGKIFEGTVRSIGYGVTDKQGDQRGDLPTVSGSSSWMRDPQRFPVIIEFDDETARGLRRAGGQANVVVYTGDHGWLNTLAAWRLKLVSWFSYAR